ncbi:unnamed protein product, partial [marine sediment metagenome]
MKRKTRDEPISGCFKTNMKGIAESSVINKIV